MATPWQVYATAAQKFGGVDPDDTAAVDRFFTSTIKDLSRSDRAKVLRYVLQLEMLALQHPQG